MGLFEALKAFADAVNYEYERRIKAASNVKEYDPTGALHHGHVEVQNEQVVAVEDAAGPHGDGRAVHETQSTEHSAPRQVTHR